MQLVLKKVGDLCHMEATGTPEEIAAYVALLGVTPVSDVAHRVRVELNSTERQGSAFARAQREFENRQTEGVA